MAAPNRAPGAGLQDDDRRAAPALDESYPELTSVRSRDRRLDGSGGRVLQEGTAQPQRLENLVEAYPNAGSDITGCLNNQLRLHPIIRWPRMINAQITRDAGSAAHHADCTELLSERFFQAAGFLKSVPQTFVLIVDRP